MMTHVQDSTKNNKMKSHIEIIKEKNIFKQMKR